MATRKKTSAPEGRTDPETIAILREKRDGYAEEAKNHRFQLDAYQGSGGFQGKIRAAETAWESQLYLDYSAENQQSYLDRYPRESEKKFRQRRDVAWYPNYVEPLTDIKLGFLFAKAFERQNVPDVLLNWAEGDVTGEGQNLLELRGITALRAALFGWTPSMVDLPAIAPEDAPITLAQAQVQGRMPKVIPLMGVHLPDWQKDGEGFEWIKISIPRRVRESPFHAVREQELITIWYRDSFQWWLVEEDRVIDESEEPIPHAFGMPPIAIMRPKRPMGGEIKGRPMHGQIALANRRIFNLTNEIDVHIRDQLFAILCVPVARDPNTKKTDPIKDLTVGTRNAISFDADAPREPFYIAPPATVAKTLEDRIASMVQEIYRMAGVEFVRPSGDEPSGVSRRYAFETTNTHLKAFAKEIAEWEQQILVLAGRALGISEDVLSEIRVVPPTSFDVEELIDTLAYALDLQTLKIGATAIGMVRKKVAKAAIGGKPSPEVEKAIEEEIDEIGRREEQDGAAARAALQAAARGARDPDEDEDDEEPPPGDDE